MGQPRKPRRVLLDSSDNESTTSSQRAQTPKKVQKTRKITTPSRTRSSASQIGVSQSVRSNTEPSPDAAKPIYAFFNGSTARKDVVQQKVTNPEHQTPDLTDDVELIHDESDDDVSKHSVALSNGSAVALAMRKRKFPQSQGSFVSTVSSSSTANVAKFMKTTSGERKPSITIRNPDKRPWTEQFAPSTIDELAIHKRKVADVKSWFEQAINGRHSRILVLKGPAGSGKTATVRAVAQEAGISVMEWRAANGAELAAEGRVSAADQFEEFIARSGRSSGLTLSSDANTDQAQPNLVMPAIAAKSERQIILVEEFPSTHSTDSMALQSFRLALHRHMATPTVRGRNTIPIVLIVSETLTSTSTSLSDSFTLHRLLGTEITSHENLDIIEFNPIAPTILLKALEGLLIREARLSGRRKAPGLSILKHLAESGDIRSAIATLEFLLLQSDNEENWSYKINFSKTKKTTTEVPLTAAEEDLLKVLSDRGSTLTIFHAAGRVVYNNRLDPTPDINVVQPPDWMPENWRIKIPERSSDELINQVGTDISTFISALQENYALSCSSAYKDRSLDSLDGCAADISDADLLSLDRFSSASRNYAGTNSDGLRQDELAFHLAVNGLLFHLPYPVNRPTLPGMRKGDAHRMFFPTSIKSWKSMDENEGKLRSLMQKAKRNELFSYSHQDTRASGGVESWQARNTFSSTSPAEQDTADSNDEIACTSVTKAEMLLERLPYLTQILANRALDRTRARDLDMVKDLVRVGRTAQTDAIGDEEALAEYAASGTEPIRPAFARDTNFETKGYGAQNLSDEAQILILEDDDIVD